VHDVARHQVGDLYVHRLAAAGRGDVVADLRVHRLRGALSAVLVGEPEPDRRRDDHPDDEGIEPLADDPGHGRRCKQQPQQRALQLAGQHRPCARMMGTHRVRAEELRPCRDLRRGQPRRPGPDCVENLVRGERRGRLDRRRRGSAERGSGDGHTQVWAATHLKRSASARRLRRALLDRSVGGGRCQRAVRGAPTRTRNITSRPQQPRTDRARAGDRTVSEVARIDPSAACLVSAAEVRAEALR
jgi:hypothetical protein